MRLIARNRNPGRPRPFPTPLLNLNPRPTASKPLLCLLQNRMEAQTPPNFDLFLLKETAVITTRYIQTIAPVLGQLLPVPVALNRAIDIARQFGLLRIVIMLDDETVWNPEWGTLREG